MSCLIYSILKFNTSNIEKAQAIPCSTPYFNVNGYDIEDYCLGHQRGIDIVSSKNNKKFLIEVKGARANDDSPIKKRKFFDSGQIKDHLGKAIVKSLETQKKFKDADIGFYSCRKYFTCS